MVSCFLTAGSLGVLSEKWRLYHKAAKMLQTKITAIRPTMACLPARGFSGGRDEDVKAVGAIEGEADVFCFFAAASAFCDVEGDVLPFSRKAGKGGEGGKGKKDFLACVFYGSGAEAALAVPASNRSVIAHNVCGDIIIGNSFSLD